MGRDLQVAGDSSETSRRLLIRAQRGDATAMGALVSRYLPRLRRWAHGRLPQWVRRGADTSDVVQDALTATLRNLDSFEPHSRHALACYLRAAVRNRIRDAHRRGKWRFESIEPADPEQCGATAFDRLRSKELASRYRAAVGRLSPADRDLIVGHIELDYSHAQLAHMTGRSPNAARMALKRAVERLAIELGPG